MSSRSTVILAADALAESIGVTCPVGWAESGLYPDSLPCRNVSESIHGRATE